MFPQTAKQWKDFQNHFTKRNKDPKKQGTTRNAGYHGVNFPRATGYKENGQELDLASLTEAITLQIPANSTNFARMMNLFTQQMTNVVQFSTRCNSRSQTGDRPKTYC